MLTVAVNDRPGCLGAHGSAGLAARAGGARWGWHYDAAMPASPDISRATDGGRW
jgi:hypothetical protein